MKTHQIYLIFISLILLLLGSYIIISSNHPNKTSRDFKAWLSTIPPNPWGDTSLRALIRNLNGVVTVQQQDSWLESITEAAKSFPDFCNSGDEAKDKQEFSAFLTIIGYETSFNSANGFPCTIENGCPNCDVCSYNSLGKECLEDDLKQYFGRGPLQLSWNYNYGPFSQYYFQDDRLLSNPNILTTNQTYCWASAIWFWMTKQNYGGWCMPQVAWPGKNQCDLDCPNGPSSCKNSQCTSNHWMELQNASCHDAIHTGNGIGQVINIINGLYDCCPSSTYFAQGGHTIDRISSFVQILENWNEPIPFKVLNPAPIYDCPIALNHVNCQNIEQTGSCRAM
ncbi:class I chitinase (macronuclear) [Tetrahymena thermophila SB210]|uniref:Class I chitinase n=1 Tax=Tetrahymena thermophila (strain SB210) TaxID=312017 RepID=I7MN47_TETTS|nr:class I chitinase [Tetrahymena thermophila SB210]EAS07903.1 class I chitinase [Tetrahymena thermophila SB210]|eukprot:XP_001028145.1 class I chitinase [Tetrahymena thermophila SB210]